MLLFANGWNQLALNLDIVDSHLVSRDSCRCQFPTSLINVDSVCIITTRGNSRSTDSGACSSEGDRSKVCKWYQRAAWLKVFDDPLRIFTAQGSRAFTREGVWFWLSAAGVLKCRNSALITSFCNLHRDNVSRCHRKARVRNWCGGDVLIPGLVTVLAILNTPEDSSLDQAGLASVSIDSNPSCTTILLARVTTRWILGRRDSKATLNLSDAWSANNGASPVWIMGYSVSSY